MAQFLSTHLTLLIWSVKVHSRYDNFQDATANLPSGSIVKALLGYTILALLAIMYVKQNTIKEFFRSAGRTNQSALPTRPSVANLDVKKDTKRQPKVAKQKQKQKLPRNSKVVEETTVEAPDVKKNRSPTSKAEVMPPLVQKVQSGVVKDGQGNKKEDTQNEVEKFQLPKQQLRKQKKQRDRQAARTLTTARSTVQAETPETCVSKSSKVSPGNRLQHTTPQVENKMPLKTSGKMEAMVEDEDSRPKPIEIVQTIKEPVQPIVQPHKASTTPSNRRAPAARSAARTQPDITRSGVHTVAEKETRDLQRRRLHAQPQSEKAPEQVPVTEEAFPPLPGSVAEVIENNASSNQTDTVEENAGKDATMIPIPASSANKEMRDDNTTPPMILESETNEVEHCSPLLNPQSQDEQKIPNPVQPLSSWAEDFDNETPAERERRERRASESERRFLSVRRKMSSSTRARSI